MPDTSMVMNPYHQEKVRKNVETFYRNYYSDNRKRIFIFGINPGRHGAGITGIPFTDPIRLSEVCGIDHHHQHKPELSSVFIYQTIQAYGGISKFASDFYITSVCPLGFIRDGKNLNYYDDKKLQAALYDLIDTNIRKQMAFGADVQRCICLGEGKNYKFLSALNDKMKFFSEIVPLPHPRWVMQYKRKNMEEYVQNFVGTYKRLKRLLNE